MPAQQNIQLDTGAVEVRLSYELASTGATACFLYATDRKTNQKVSATSAADGSDVFALPDQSLKGRLVFLEAHVFAVDHVPAPVRATARVVQGGQEKAALSDSATVLEQSNYAIFRFAFGFAT